MKYLSLLSLLVAFFPLSTNANVILNNVTFTMTGEGCGLDTCKDGIATLNQMVGEECKFTIGGATLKINGDCGWNIPPSEKPVIDHLNQLLPKSCPNCEFTRI